MSNKYTMAIVWKSWTVPDSFCGFLISIFWMIPWGTSCSRSRCVSEEMKWLVQPLSWAQTQAMWFQVIFSSCMLSTLVHRHFWILHSRIYRRYGCLSSDCILKGSCILCWNQVLKSTLGPKLPLKNPWSPTRHGTFSSHAGSYLLSMHLSVDGPLCVSTFCLLWSMSLWTFMYKVFTWTYVFMSRGPIPRKGIVFWWGHCSVKTGLSRWNSFSLLSCHVYSVEFKEVEFREVVSLL